MLILICLAPLSDNHTFSSIVSVSMASNDSIIQFVQFSIEILQYSIKYNHILFCRDTRQQICKYLKFCSRPIVGLIGPIANLYVIAYIGHIGNVESLEERREGAIFIASCQQRDSDYAAGFAPQPPPCLQAIFSSFFSVLRRII